MTKKLDNTPRDRTKRVCFSLVPSGLVTFQVLLPILFVVSLTSCGSDKNDRARHARFVTRIDWIDRGQWLKVDTHVHTTFSDGKSSIAEVIQAARNNGCDAIAITDHANRDLRAATAEYFAEIQDVRKQFNDIIVISGVEWNVPPYQGDEHANVLVRASDEDCLIEFARLFDDYQRTNQVPVSAQSALTWLEESASSKPVVFLNHPARKRIATESIIDDVSQWNASPKEILVGFSGAPGHQAQDPVGSYRGTLKTIDRWDPSVATVGGAWDKLLGRGIDCWAALAPSDFHSEKNGDFSPGVFSEIWVYAPGKSEASILEALRRGSFFANHGGVAREVELLVSHQNLDRPARPGESIEVSHGTIDVSIRLTVPTTDWEGLPNQINQIELIAIGSESAEVLIKKSVTGAVTELLSNFSVPQDGIAFRARGRRVVADGPDLLFVTNPVRIVGPKRD